MANDPEEQVNPVWIPSRGPLFVSGKQLTSNSFKLFVTSPLNAPLLVINESSDSRDHCANERTFLSWIKLAVYMDVVSVAIFINFHFKAQPTPLEHRISKPLGIIFWILSVVCVVNGLSNYIRTVARYARRRAMVQYGRKTQFVFIITCGAIMAACILFIIADAQRANAGSQ